MVQNVQIPQIENQTYQKTALSQTNVEATLPQQIRNQAKLSVKDELPPELRAEFPDPEELPACLRKRCRYAQ